MTFPYPLTRAGFAGALLARSGIALVLAAGLLVPAASTTSAASHPRRSETWKACKTELDGVRTSVGATKRSVTIVNQTGKTHARVSFYVRRTGACSLERLFITKTARLGYGGTVPGTKRKQGTGTTPLGGWCRTGLPGVCRVRIWRRGDW